MQTPIETAAERRHLRSKVDAMLAEVNGNIIVSRSDDPNHFHPDYFGAGKTWKDPHLDRVLISYRLAGEMFAAAGRQIVNATVGGKLEIFDRMSLADAVRG